jgi:hypothetical protein
MVSLMLLIAVTNNQGPYMYRKEETSAECFMLLQISSLLKNRILAEKSLSEADLQSIWKAYQNLYTFWDVVFESKVIPPTQH